MGYEQMETAEVQSLLQEHQIRQAGFEPIVEFGAKHKYLLNVDGVVSSWRLSSLLQTGSVLLLQESPTWEASFLLLSPWVHFVPIASDLSNLIEMVEYLEANPRVAEEMARAAADAFAQHLRSQDTYCFAMRSLLHVAGPMAGASASEAESLA